MQNSFTGGEFSPVMDARQDLEKYVTGVKTMKNFFVLPHGAATNRPGAYFRGETKDSTKKSRLIPFQFSEEQAYVIEFGHLYCRFFRNSGQVLVGGDPYEIVSPYAATDLASLKFTQSADVMYLVHSKYKPKLLSRTNDTAWSVTDFNYKEGPFAPVNLTVTTITPSGVTGDITLTASSSTFSAAQVGALWKFEHDIEAQIVSGQVSSGTTTSDALFFLEDASLTVAISGVWTGASIAVKISSDDSAYSTLAVYTANTSVTFEIPALRWCKVAITGVTAGECTVSLSKDSTVVTTIAGTPTGVSNSIKGLGQWTLTTHGIWTGKMYLEKSEDDGATWKKMRTYSSVGEYNVAASGTEDDGLVRIRVRTFEWTSGTVNIDLQFEPFTVVGIARITAVTDATHANATVLKELGSATATDVWNEGAWSEHRGWPAANVFYQNRLFFGNTVKEPQTLWGSKTGDYINFSISFPVVDDDAVSAPLVSEQVNAIRSLKALDKILGLTVGGHWKIGPGGDSSALTPTSITAVQQGYYGASSLDPLIIGNRILYTQKKGSIVRDIGYDFSSDSYMGNDLTLFAEHLFRNRRIIEWAYQQEPNGIIWGVCDDGALLGFTYLKEQNVWGWHRHETDGLFESVCTIPGEDRDEVWFIVNRAINGVTKRYVEQMAARMVTTDPADQYFVDCGLSYVGEPVATFSGLEHLEGKTVSILADGNVHPTQVVTDGTITLTSAASKVHVGLGYTCDLETLNVDFPAKDGTIQTRNKRITKATLRVENTRGAFIGSSFDKMYELKMRSNENWDTPIALYSGDKDMQFNTGSNKTGHVCVRMTDPLPITILAIVAEVTLDG
jgi:hypothetical protein